MRAAGTGPKSATHKVGDPLVELVDQTLGPYHTDRLLGRGHSGAVYHATNTKTGQVVALKVLAPEFPATPAELERFAQELKVVQPVRHANLVGLLGAGKTATHCWIAREFVEGESAAAVIARIAEGREAELDPSRPRRGSSGSRAGPPPPTPAGSRQHHPAKRPAPDQRPRDQAHGPATRGDSRGEPVTAEGERRRNSWRSFRIWPRSRSRRAGSSIASRTCTRSVRWPTRCVPAAAGDGAITGGDPRPDPERSREQAESGVQEGSPRVRCDRAEVTGAESGRPVSDRVRRAGRPRAARGKPRPETVGRGRLVGAAVSLSRHKTRSGRRGTAPSTEAHAGECSSDRPGGCHEPAADACGKVNRHPNLGSPNTHSETTVNRPTRLSDWKPSKLAKSRPSS